MYKKGIMGGTGGYGDFVKPIAMGSRGGTGGTGNVEGGNGGASIQIRTFLYLHVDGTMKVNGLAVARMP